MLVLYVTVNNVSFILGRVLVFLGKISTEQKINGPRREKTCLRGFRQSEIQTSLPSYRDALENRNFTRSKFTYETYKKSE